MATGTDSLRIEATGLPAVHAVSTHFPDHDPAPRLQPIDLPDRTGQIALYKTGEDSWTVHRLDGPSEGVARHTFRSLESLVRWLKVSSRAPSRAQVFVQILSDLATPEIQARLDPGDPEGDRVTCAVAHAPAFKAWAVETRGKALSQKGLFTLVRGFGWAIEGANVADVLLSTLARLRVVGKVELQCELASNGRTTVAGVTNGVSVSVELPGELTIRVPIFQGVVDESTHVAKTYSIRAILDVDADPSSGLSISIAFPDLAEILARAAVDLVEHLQRELGEGWTVCLGTESTSEANSRTDVLRVGHPAPAAFGHIVMGEAV